MTTKSISERIAASGAQESTLGHIMNPAYEVIVEEVTIPSRKPLVGTHRRSDSHTRVLSSV